MHQLSYNDYLSKIRACWWGKSLGGIVGAPYENHKQFNEIDDEKLWPSILYANDDLDIQVVWLEALQEYGLHLDSDVLADFWRDRCFYSCCEYGKFLHNLERGIRPPLSGTFDNDFFNASEGCPIRSEIWACVFAGNPELAARYAAFDGALDHGRISIEIEQFLASSEALAFVMDDPEAIFARAEKLLPSDSAVHAVRSGMNRILDQSDDPFIVWRNLLRAFGDRDASKAVTNLAIVLAVLRLGRGDFKKTMKLCINFGWDTDCTAATVGAFLGILKGETIFPEDWKTKMGKNLDCAVNIKHKNAPLDTFAEEIGLLGAEAVRGLNNELELTGAPDVALRPEPVRTVRFKTEYPDGPTLHGSGTTSVILHANSLRAGTLKLTPPENCECTPALFHIAKGHNRIETSVRRIDERAVLRDSNLFRAELDEIEYVFGLAGAKRWRVYGPYWDMWNRELYDICPYHNDKVMCNPGNINMGFDYANLNLRPRHHYLDEERLLREDLTEELPFDIEVQGELVDFEKFCAFRGCSCWYFTRNIVAAPRKHVLPSFGHTTPAWFWFDGRLVVHYPNAACWTPDLDLNREIEFTGKPQRLVVKIACFAETFRFSAAFFDHDINPDRKHGISEELDTVGDIQKPIRQKDFFFTKNHESFLSR